jgi:hypothetical protein
MLRSCCCTMCVQGGCNHPAIACPASISAGRDSVRRFCHKQCKQCASSGSAMHETHALPSNSAGTANPQLGTMHASCGDLPRPLQLQPDQPPGSPVFAVGIAPPIKRYAHALLGPLCSPVCIVKALWYRRVPFTAGLLWVGISRINLTGRYRGHVLLKDAAGCTAQCAAQAQQESQQQGLPRCLHGCVARCICSGR